MRVILDRDDFRSKRDGYHLDMFDGLLISLGTPEEEVKEYQSVELYIDGHKPMIQ